MLKEYFLSDILRLPAQHIPYFAGTFEATEDPEIEWPHRHSFYSLVWLTEGAGYYVIDFEEYAIRPDRIFLVNPKQIHNWDYSENSKGYILMVDATLGMELGLSDAFPYLDIDKRNRHLLSSVFLDLIENFQRENDITTDIRYIYQQIDRFAEQNKVSRVVTHPSIASFKTLIAENYDQPHTVEWYAGKLSLPADKLNALCMENTGVTAKRYLLDLKITEAKRLLLYSSCNIDETAFRLGFDDSSYFARIFKKKTSLSPTGFVKKYRKQG